MRFRFRGAALARYGVFLPVLLITTLCTGSCLSNLPVDIPGVTTPGPTDEQQIVSLLEDVHRGMQSRRVFKVLAHVSRTYRDDSGRDYDMLEQYLTELFRNYKLIEVTRVRPKVLVQGDRARAIETFGSRAVPFNDAEHRPIEVHGQMNIYLQRFGNEWKIVEWGRVY